MTVLPHTQRGATLLIALVMLLIVTLLAISSMRETTLESRMTGSVLEQKRLFNSAESGLRDAEKRLTNLVRPPERCNGNNMSVTPLCILNRDPSYDTPDFTGSVAYKGSDNATKPDRETSWYVIQAYVITPQYGDAMKGKGGIFAYEINSQAKNSKGGKSILRSVVVRQFN